MQANQQVLTLQQNLKNLLLNEGACDVGFAASDDGPAQLPYLLSIVIHLSDAVLDEIHAAPTYTYFHHYRTVNALIDRLLFLAGICCQKTDTTGIQLPLPKHTPPTRSHSAGNSPTKKRLSWRVWEPLVVPACFCIDSMVPACG